MVFEKFFPKEQKAPLTKSKYYLTKREVKDWAWKDYDLYKEVFKSSPSKREEILKLVILLVFLHFYTFSICLFI